MMLEHEGASLRGAVFARLRRVVDRGLLGNIAALSGVQLASYALPLVTIPYLTRVLGIAGWGSLAHVQAFATVLSTLVDFKFTASATREVARHKDDPVVRAGILAAVMGAKVLLTALAVVVAATVAQVSPRLAEDARLFWAGVFWAIAQSVNLLWYFQGLERMRLVAALDIAGKALGATGIFVFVRGPGDAWKALAVQGMALLLLPLSALVPAYRDVPFRAPTPRLAWAALRSGWILFISQIFINLYTAGITLTLGLVTSPTVVGYYAGGAKIARASVGILHAISQALFPRINWLVSQRHDEARAQWRAWLYLMTIIGLAVGSGLFVAAPILVRVVLGEGFEPSILVLRILALLPPLIALSTVFGIQWMVPLGLDRQFNGIVMATGIAAVLLTLPAASAYGHVGAALTAVFSEALVTGLMLVVLSNKGLNPLARAPKGDQRANAGAAPVPALPVLAAAPDSHGSAAGPGGAKNGGKSEGSITPLAG